MGGKNIFTESGREITISPNSALKSNRNGRMPVGVQKTPCPKVNEVG